MAIKDPDGRVPDTAIRNVAIAKDGSYRDDDYAVEPEAEVDLIATIGYRLKSAPLAGFVLEGFTYGRSPQAHDTGFCSERYTAGFQSFASDAATPRALYHWTTRPSLAARTSPRQWLGSC